MDDLGAEVATRTRAALEDKVGDWPAVMPDTVGRGGGVCAVTDAVGEA